MFSLKNCMLNSGNCLTYSVIVVFLSLLLGGCAEPWISSIDAGFRYNTKNHRTMVFDVSPGTISEEAGLKPGDIVLAVDGEDITSAPKRAVMVALKGPIGTMAVLTIKRGSQIMEISVERKRR